MRCWWPSGTHTLKPRRSTSRRRKKKYEDASDFLTQEDVILDLYLFHRTGKLPEGVDPQDLSRPQKRFLLTALALLGDFTIIETRARTLYRLQKLKSSRDLDVLPDGMLFRLVQFGIDPLREAQTRRQQMIKKLERELME
jgi:hypothetical protein